MNLRLYADQSSIYFNIDLLPGDYGVSSFAYSILEHSTGVDVLGDDLLIPREITLTAVKYGDEISNIQHIRSIFSYMYNSTLYKFSLRYPLSDDTYNLPDSGATCYYQLLNPQFGEIRVNSLTSQSMTYTLTLFPLTPYMIKRNGGTVFAPTGVTKVYPPW